MKLFLVGTSKFETAVKKYKPLYVLESFQYVKPWQMQEMKNWNLFYLDSGAYTFLKHQAKSHLIDWEGYLSKYISFINQHDIKYFMELDIDAMVGYPRVKEMRKRLEQETSKKCIPVWHRSRGLNEFKRMCREYDSIAIGGFAIKSIRPKEYDYIKKLVRVADSFGTKVHGLGYARNDLLDYGFNSTDTASWILTTVYGGLSYFENSRIRTVRPPDGFIGNRHMERAEISLKEWVKYQKYLDRKG